MPSGCSQLQVRELSPAQHWLKTSSEMGSLYLVCCIIQWFCIYLVLLGLQHTLLSTLRYLHSQLHFVNLLQHKMSCSTTQTGTFCPAQQSVMVSSSWTGSAIHAPFNSRTFSILRRLMHRSELNCSHSGSAAKEWLVRFAKKTKIKCCWEP